MSKNRCNANSCDCTDSTGRSLRVQLFLGTMMRMAPDPVLDDDRLTMAGLFFEASAGLERTLERRLSQECGLSVQWFELLLRLARSPGQRLRMCDLAAQVAMSPSGLTRAIDRLEAEGLVEREHCPSDRRVAWAKLTPAGLARIETAVPVHLGHLDEHFFGALGDDELAQVTAAMRTLRDHVNPDAAQLSVEPTEPIEH
jgi:MarR family 2-MHQ and catechol resistance regulon transcriptional repressor